MTVAEWLRKGESYLESRAVCESRANAEWLMAELLGVGRPAALLQGARVLREKEAHQYWAWIKERGKRRPLAYVLGHQPFLGIKIMVDADCLIPRPETEELVLECERLLKGENSQSAKILEIGTGTGCIAIALAQLLPRATVFATDVSDKALKLAEKNAVANHVGTRIRFVKDDLFSGRWTLRGWADLLVSNPPYVATAELDRLDPEVRAEPRLALDGGKDGLDAVREISARGVKMLKPGGWLALEIGSTQGPAAAELLGAAGLSDVLVKKDAQGLDRMVFGRLPP
ncbi:MAG: peptide chain release factor N(5)-glutamine methyltransferase [Elusimicrobiota bacterium]